MACRKRAASRVAERRWWATIRRQALRGASQVRCPIGCQVALARRLPTNLMSFQKLSNPYQQASRLLWLLRARLVTWLAFPRAERRNLAEKFCTSGPESATTLVYQHPTLPATHATFSPSKARDDQPSIILSSSKGPILFPRARMHPS